jgi:uncharacterized protein YfdQ (DUF2303 family)
MPDDPQTEAAVVADLAHAAAGVRSDLAHPDEGGVLLVRERTVNHASMLTQDHVRVLDLEPWADRPRRRRGNVTLDDAASFERYVNEFKADGSTRIYASLTGHIITAVFNDDTPSPDDDAAQGAWRDHRAHLTLQPTDDWTTWARHDRRLMSQADFAQHLEDNLPSIATPASADLVEVARSFQATNDVQFRSALNLASGETRFAYDESVEAKAGAKGNLEVPSQFTLRLAPYEGCDLVDVVARLRFKISGGNLQLGYFLVDADRIKRAAWDEVIGAVGSVTGIEPLMGTPAPAHTEQLADRLQRDLS